VFVQGGPGVGKGTNCAKLCQEFGFVHLSAGDLLRAEKNKESSADGALIRDLISTGALVPAGVTIRLLQKALEQNHGKMFLIDGFPSRSLADAKLFIEEVGAPKFALCYAVSKDAMTSRIAASGKSVNSLLMLEKRYATYLEQSEPVKEYLKEIGLVREINAEATEEEVYAESRELFL